MWCNESRWAHMWTPDKCVLSHMFHCSIWRTQHYSPQEIGKIPQNLGKKNILRLIQPAVEKPKISEKSPLLAVWFAITDTCRHIFGLTFVGLSCPMPFLHSVLMQCVQKAVMFPSFRQNDSERYGAVRSSSVEREVHSMPNRSGMFNKNYFHQNLGKIRCTADLDNL